MKPNREEFRMRPLVLLVSASLLVNTTTTLAGTTQLADIPLANSTTVDILPNIMFILDDSGSMDWDFMPDYVEGNYCRDNYTEDSNTDGSLDLCRMGDPPFMASAFNRVYYNPNISYTPPKNADGTSQTSYATYTSVPLDGYGIQFTSTDSYPRDNGVYVVNTTVTRDDWAYNLGYNINLTSLFPERKWCTSGSNSGTCTSNTKATLNASNQYVYPDTTYKYLRTVYGAPYYYNVTVEWCSSRNTTGTDKNFGKSGTCQARKTGTFKYVRFTNWERIDITPARTSYPGPDGTTRTYDEEMTNFANWFAWYRSRMQAMKTGVSQAFTDVRGTPNATDATDKNYFHARVGFTTISSTNATDGTKYLAIGNFDHAASGPSQKGTWFSRLQATVPSSSTPLRAALAKAGRIYAGKLGTDPIQYSCQRNFTILSTDGYWNTGNETASYGPDKEDGSTNVGDQDGSTAVTRPSYDKLAKADTLADVAYYYYHTDLRPGTCVTCENNVPPAGTNADVDDTAIHQHMTTFTIGLGVDGTLAYKDGYKTSTSGDYYDIKQGTKNWPDPISNSADERIDDLWHAAVNGRGTYFSARDPETLVDGLTTALGAMESTTGSGAAAATSNLEPTEGDSYIYIANYRTVKWDGELSAYGIDTANGTISSSSSWQAGTLLDGKIDAAGNSDTRAIYTSVGSALKNFLWADINAAGWSSYFATTQLSQYADWSATEVAAATSETLVNYLRGHHRNEDQDRDASFGTYYRLYRDREKVLGDIVHAQPVYVKAPFNNFTDSGYSSFKSSQSSRAPTVYVAANDGMLHAFDASSGQERWGYIPPMVIKNLWRLADKDYTTNHRFFVDGPIAVNDVQVGGSWKTILVGGLGNGGRGYYALDITVPSSPQVLWTFSADNNPNMGYSFGIPMITKINGSWVVMLTSGYNNVPEGGNYPTADGGGYIFILDAGTGAVLTTLSTGVGSPGNPSGLARVNIQVSDFDTDNTALAVYGGDLFGNMWKWKFDTTAISATRTQVAALGSTQPITAAPELGDTDGETVLFFGTGRYLGSDDLANTDTQAVYAIKDDGTVKWTYPLTPGERVHLEAQLYFGTLLVATTIPSATECQPGGYGRLYYFNYKDASAVGTSLYDTFTNPIVGFTVAKVGDTPVVYPVTADGKKPSPTTVPIGPPEGGSSASGTRVMWRELLD